MAVQTRIRFFLSTFQLRNIKRPLRNLCTPFALFWIEMEVNGAVLFEIWRDRNAQQCPTPQLCPHRNLSQSLRLYEGSDRSHQNSAALLSVQFTTKFCLCGKKLNISHLWKAFQNLVTAESPTLSTTNSGAFIGQGHRFHQYRLVNRYKHSNTENRHLLLRLDRHKHIVGFSFRNTAHSSAN